jgi:hypothetical protein
MLNTTFYTISVLLYVAPPFIRPTLLNEKKSHVGVVASLEKS